MTILDDGIAALCVPVSLADLLFDVFFSLSFVLLAFIRLNSDD